MAYKTLSTVTTVEIDCDNCGDVIYSGDAANYDDTKAFHGFMPTALGAPANQALLYCAGTTCAHNCSDALRQAVNALPGRVAPPIAPLQPAVGPQFT